MNTYAVGDIAFLFGFSIFTIICFLFLSFYFLSLSVSFSSDGWILGSLLKNFGLNTRFYKLQDKICLLVLLAAFTLSHKTSAVCAAIIRSSIWVFIGQVYLMFSRWAPKINFFPSPASHTEIHFFIIYPAWPWGYLIMQLLIFAPWNQLSSDGKCCEALCWVLL